MVNTAPFTGSDTEPTSPEVPSTPRWAWALTAIVALVPVARMGLLVLRAHPLPYNDYWPMMDSMLTADGGFDPSGLFELRNEHPLVVAKLLYWINLQVTGGSNVALGLVVVGITLGQLAVVVVLSRDLARRWVLAPPLLTAAAAYLLFGRQGAWHFVKSMSGAAWLTANLFALLALWAQVRGRRVLPVVFAALATLSYGTGLAIWPVLILVGLLSGARLRHLVPTLALGIVATLWLQVQLAGEGKTAADRPPLLVWGARGAEVIGAFLFPSRRVTDIRVGEALVAVGVVGALVVIYRLVRHSTDASRSAPWIGLVAYGAGMGLLVSAGRNTFLWTGTAGRYSAIGAITCIGVVGLVLSLLPRDVTAGRVAGAGAFAAISALCVLVLLGGGREVERLDASYAVQDLLAVGLETRVFDQSRLWLGNIQAIDSDAIEDRLERAGQDFHVDDSLDCGLLGTALPAEDRSVVLPEGVGAEVVRVDAGGSLVPLGMVVEGRVDGAEIDCAVLVAPDGEVVGAGGSGSARRGYGGPGATDIDGREWFSVLGPLTEGATVHVRLDGGDELYAVPSPP